MASSSYAARVTARIPGVLAQHPGWSQTEASRFLRGHGVPGSGVTPEHGELTKTIAHGRAGNVTLDRPTYRDSKVIGDVNRAADKDQRVAINVRTKAGDVQQIGQNRGFSAAYVAQVIADHNGDLRKALAQLIAENRRGRTSDPIDLGEYDDADDYAEDVYAWQVVAYE